MKFERVCLHDKSVQQKGDDDTVSRINCAAFCVCISLVFTWVSSMIHVDWTGVRQGEVMYILVVWRENIPRKLPVWKYFSVFDSPATNPWLIRPVAMLSLRMRQIFGHDSKTMCRRWATRSRSGCFTDSRNEKCLRVEVAVSRMQKLKMIRNNYNIR